MRKLEVDLLDQFHRQMTTFLCVGSIQPDPDLNYKIGYHLEQSLSEQTRDDLDAIIFTGVTCAEPHHASRGPEEMVSMLEEQFSRFVGDIPIYFVPGKDYWNRDRYRSQSQYGYLDIYDEEFREHSDHLWYIPNSDHLEIGSWQVSQNHQLASENGLIISPSYQPELVNTGAVVICGGEYVGRRFQNSLVPMFALHDVGPGENDRLGAVYIVSLSDEGIESITIRPIGDVDSGVCEAHKDRGKQDLLPDQECIYCQDNQLYFQEILRSIVSEDGFTSNRISDLIRRVDDRYSLSEAQMSDLETYLASNLDVTDIIPDRQLTIAPGTEDMRDPRSIRDRPMLYASQQQNLSRDTRASYYSNHDVIQPQSSGDVGSMPTDYPPAQTETERGFDRRAWEIGETRGEWMCFPSYSEINDAWQFVGRMVAEGIFFDARVSTEWARAARETHAYGLWVCVPNYFDFTDVKRVYNILDEVPSIPSSILNFKTILYSKLGIHGGNFSEHNLNSSLRYDQEIFEDQ